MSLLLPFPVKGVRPSPSVLRPSAPAKGLVYTLLRHGQGLSHEESALRLGEALRSTPDGPTQAA